MGVEPPDLRAGRSAEDAEPPPPPIAHGAESFAKKADDLESIRGAVDDAAAVGGALWFSYLFVLFYLAVAAGAVTHADLFLENPVKLPFLNIDLPLLAFFTVAPILFLFAHGYTLMHLVMLTEKAKDYDEALREQIGTDGLTSDKLRRQLPSNIFIQYLAGPANLRKSAFGYALGFVAWTTLAVAPILLLLLMQLQFLPFHSSFITWTQRIVLILDLALIWWLWGTIRSGRETGARRQAPFRVGEALGSGLAVVVVLFSAAVATFPGEWQEDHLPRASILPKIELASDSDDQSEKQPNESLWDWVKRSEKVSLHDWIFNSPLDDVTRHRLFPFANTLVLIGFNVLEALHIDDPKKEDGRDFTFRARGRDLKGARFDLASLPRVDFTGAYLEGASFLSAQLDRASFEKAQLQGASLLQAHLQGASLAYAHLQGASLNYSDFRGASLDSAHLQRASLVAAHLEGASLDHAQLQEASLNAAQLQAVSLLGGQLQGASLPGAQLEGANLDGARIVGALLTNAHLQGASLSGVRLQGASLDGAQLQGAVLDGAQLQGVSLDHAHLQGAHLIHVELQGASLHGAQLQCATLYAANLKAADFSGAYLWHTYMEGEAQERMSDPSGVAQIWLPFWLDEDRRVRLWDHDTYLALRQMLDSLKPGARRDEALDQISGLGCDPSPTTDTDLPTELGALPKSDEAHIDGAVYAKALTKELRNLVCSGGEDAVYALRGLMRSRLRATGSEAPDLIAFIMSPGCPVSAKLTDDDKATLQKIKQDALRTPGG